MHNGFADIAIYLVGNNVFCNCICNVCSVQMYSNAFEKFCDYLYIIAHNDNLTMGLIQSQNTKYFQVRFTYYRPHLTFASFGQVIVGWVNKASVTIKEKKLSNLNSIPIPGPATLCILSILHNVLKLGNRCKNYLRLAWGFSGTE